MGRMPTPFPSYSELAEKVVRLRKELNTRTPNAVVNNMMSELRERSADIEKLRELNSRQRRELRRLNRQVAGRSKPRVKTTPAAPPPPSPLEQEFAQARDLALQAAVAWGIAFRTPNQSLRDRMAVASGLDSAVARFLAAVEAVRQPK